MLKSYEVVENLLPLTSMQVLKNVLTNGQFPWFYQKIIAVPDDEIEAVPHHKDVVTSSGFVHTFCYYHNGNFTETSPYYSLIKQLFGDSFKKLGVDLQKIWRSKANFSTPQPHFAKGSIEIPHVDYTNDHTTFLFYVNNADAGTVIFNEQYKNNVVPSEVTIKEVIPHRENSVLIFNGLTYHTGSVPIESSTRINVNINFGYE